MPRLARPDFPGLWLHVMSRGNNRQPIFREKDDYGRFIRLMHRAFALSGVSLEIHAFCLMTNHLHMLIRILKGGLSRYMDYLLGCYAGWHNKRYGRVGHLFQGRFRSKIVASNLYIARVADYIHENPVAAGIVEKATDYGPSSIHDYVGGSSGAPVVTSVLAGLNLSDYGPEGEIAPGPEGWPDSVDWYLADVGADGPSASSPAAGDAPQDSRLVTAAVARCFRVSEDTLLSRSRRNGISRARSAAAYLLSNECGLQAKQIADVLSFDSAAGVWNVLSRFRAQLRSDQDLKRRLQIVSDELKFR